MDIINSPCYITSVKITKESAVRLTSSVSILLQPPLQHHCVLTLTRVPVPQDQVIPAGNILPQGHLYIGGDLRRNPHLNIVVCNIHHIRTGIVLTK